MTYYDDIAKGYNELHKSEQEVKIRTILNHIIIQPKDIILDVGGGPCFLTGFINNNIINIDPSEKLLNQSKAYKNIQASMESIPLPNKSIDIVICISSFHHSTNPNLACKEMIRVGKERYVITLLNNSKNHQNLKEILKKHFTIQKEIVSRHDTIYILYPI